MSESTARLYLDDAYCFEHAATVLAADARGVRLDRSCLFPGGGGQPPDAGELRLTSGERIAVVSAAQDAAGAVWHHCGEHWHLARPGESCTVHVDRIRRLRLMRAHTALHVFNTVMLRSFGGWITGVKMGPERSHIDFKVDYSSELPRRVEGEVNEVLARGHPVDAHYVAEEEFRRRPDLLRTLEAEPPIESGRVRIVEIGGFESQACGGTHVSNTLAVGRVKVVKVDNKGRQNRRFYVELAGEGL